MRLRWTVVCSLALLCGCTGDGGEPGRGFRVPNGDVGIQIDAGPPRVPPPDGDCRGALAQCGLPDQPGISATVCGVIVDLASGWQLNDDGLGYRLCDGLAERGPCAVAVRAYDPLQLAAGPDEAEPLASGEVVIDTCGRFAIPDVAVPFNGFVAVQTSGGGLVPTVHAIPVSVGNRRVDVVAPVTDRSADEDWTLSAGDPFDGQTFSERGVALVSFVDVSGTPRAGVEVESNEPVYYFADRQPDFRTTVDPSLTATGANGSALVTAPVLRSRNPSEDDPGGCPSSDPLIASVPGVVFYGESALLEPSCLGAASR